MLQEIPDGVELIALVPGGVDRYSIRYTTGTPANRAHSHFR